MFQLKGAGEFLLNVPLNRPGKSAKLTFTKGEIYEVVWGLLPFTVTKPVTI